MSTQDTVYNAGNELRERLADLENDVRALREAAEAAAREKVRETQDAAAAFCVNRRADLKRVEQVIENRITQQPVKSTLAAAAFGFILGALWMRR